MRLHLVRLDGLFDASALVLPRRMIGDASSLSPREILRGGPDVFSGCKQTVVAGAGIAGWLLIELRGFFRGHHHFGKRYAAEGSGPPNRETPPVDLRALNRLTASN